MKLGVVFPQTEIGNDPALIKRFGQTVESLGYDFLAVYDHVLGADGNRPGWAGAYNHTNPFHEIFVLFGYFAACTEKLELVSRVLVLPQRQTALVAKQAASIAVLAGGRLRLGLGVGWNDVEFEALGTSFKDRGRRSEEQIELLRRFWAEDVVDFTGQDHRIDRAGVNPRPPGGTIPLWIGGKAEAVLRRTARLADGWMPALMTADEIPPTVERIRGYVAEAGRDPAAFGIDPSLKLTSQTHETVLREGALWRERGATHLTINTLGNGVGTAEQQLELLARFKREF